MRKTKDYKEYRKVSQRVTSYNKDNKQNDIFRIKVKRFGRKAQRSRRSYIV